MLHLKKYTSGDFYKNPTLLKFWRIISGSLFFNLDNPPILSEILRYLKNDLINDLTCDNLKQSVINFINNYLIKYYFSDSAQFNFTFFNYYLNTDSGNYNFSTNSLESINRRLKEHCGAGQLPLRKVYVKLRDFKAIYLGKFKYRVKRNNLNQRRAKTVKRREKLEEIYVIYKNLSQENQLGVSIETAYKIGNLDKMSEIEENEISLLDIDLIAE